MKGLSDPNTQVRIREHKVCGSTFGLTAETLIIIIIIDAQDYYCGRCAQAVNNSIKRLKAFELSSVL